MLFGHKPEVAVFFAAHTDDEMICAGTLFKLARQGTVVHVVTFGQAASKNDRTGAFDNKEVLDEWHKSMEIIGVRYDNRKFLDYRPSASLHTREQEICQYTYNYVELYRPDVCFVLSPEDENTAHKVVGEQCERVMRGRVDTVIRCQFPWNYSIGRNNLYVELDKECLAAKEKVINCYQSQHFRYDYLKMLTSYAIADGLSVKIPAAETFEVVRSIV